MQLKRLAGIGGLVFVALVVVINLAQGAAGRPFGDPASDGYLDDYLEYYLEADHLPNLLGPALPFIWAGLAVFAVGLAATLLRHEWRTNGEAWSVLGIVGVTMQNAIFPVVVALDLALFRTVADGAALDLGLHEAHEAIFGINSISLAIALVGFSAAMLRTGLGGTWLPRVGLAGSALLAASVVNVGFGGEVGLLGLLGLLGFILWLVFIAASSLWLLRQPPRTPEHRIEASEAASTTPV